MTDRALWHPWLRIQRLIRAILEVRRDEVTRPVLKLTLRNAIKKREKIRVDKLDLPFANGLTNGCKGPVFTHSPPKVNWSCSRPLGQGQWKAREPPTRPPRLDQGNPGNATGPIPWRRHPQPRS